MEEWETNKSNSDLKKNNKKRDQKEKLKRAVRKHDVLKQWVSNLISNQSPEVHHKIVEEVER